MREDMTKVLVEEPRHGRAYARTVQGTRRRRWNGIDADGESAPARMGMRRDGQRSKSFGEHLGPLYRYLRQQANRPWAKVYGELCAGLDRRNPVQDHLFQHIRDRVAIDTAWIDGEVFVPDWRGRQRLADSRYPLYVHPRTGILLVNRAREQAAQRRNAQRAAQARQPHPDRRIGIAGPPADRQWHRIGGLWYEVELQALVGDEVAYDVVLRRAVSTANHAQLWETYGSRMHYAARKRQLDHRTLVRHGLA